MLFKSFCAVFLILKALESSDSFLTSMIQSTPARPSSAATNPVNNRPIFEQCIINKRDLAFPITISDVIRKEFVPSSSSPFHKEYSSEKVFGVAVYKYIERTLQEAQVVCCIIVQCASTNASLSDFSD